MQTPLAGIPVPDYGSDTFETMATMASGLESLAIPRFTTNDNRDTALPTPQPGQCCAVDGQLQVFTTEWIPVRTSLGEVTSVDGNTPAQDGNVSTRITITKAAYDLISVLDPNIVYFVEG